jgi:hypothetical protein
MAITYENVFFDYCLDPLRDIFISEYSYGKIYIAPDAERIYQLLFNNKSKTTTVDSTTHTWIDGVCEGYTINEFVGGEEEIEGLNTVKYEFNCKIIRED